MSTQPRWEEVVLAPEGTPLAQFQKERTDAISEMFDNVGADGIYPTTRFFARMDECVANLLKADRAHLVEEVDELNFQNDTPAFQVLRVIKALLRKTP